MSLPSPKITRESCQETKIPVDGSARCKLRIEGDETCKEVDGVVEGLGIRPLHTLDDADADDFYMDVERESIASVKSYLREQFPGAKITGVIRSTFTSAYHGSHEYSISESCGE